MELIETPVTSALKSLRLWCLCLWVCEVCLDDSSMKNAGAGEKNLGLWPKVAGEPYPGLSRGQAVTYLPIWAELSVLAPLYLYIFACDLSAPSNLEGLSEVCIEDSSMKNAGVGDGGRVEPGALTLSSPAVSLWLIRPSASSSLQGLCLCECVRCTLKIVEGGRVWPLALPLSDCDLSSHLLWVISPCAYMGYLCLWVYKVCLEDSSMKNPGVWP